MARSLQLILVAAVGACLASQYDPHVRKGEPWFEGWYTRIVDSSKNASIGLILGAFPDQLFSDPSAYAAVIIQESGKDTATVYEKTGENSALVVNGKEGWPTSNPDFPSPPKFSFLVDNARLDTTEGTREMVFEIPPVKVRAQMAKPVPWGPNGEGPAGWVARIPLGLQWFVYSLASPAKYEVQVAGKTVLTGTGLAHEEKNWGDTFPSGWMWGEALSKTGDVQLAFAGGPVKIGPITVDGWLVGYRSPVVNVWNFHPQDPARFVPKIDACSGRFQLEATTLTHRLVITVDAPRSSYAPVRVPAATGFVTGSIESFVAVATVEAYDSGRLIETRQIPQAALEFGGSYAKCNN